MDFNRQLIELVKGCRLLYDASDVYYGDAVQRDRAWKEIAGKLDVQESECKKAWVLLREGFRRAFKKHKAALRDPVNRIDKPTTKWTYEEDLAFLAPHLKHRTLTLSSEYIHINMEENPNNAVNLVNHDAAGQRKKAKHSRTHEAATRRTCANESYSNTLIKYILDKTTKRDDIQHFFESISATVQSFPPRDRAVAKAKVFQVISQMELEILGRERTTSLQYESSPASCEAEAADPQNDLLVTQSPAAPSPSLLEPQHSTDDEIEPVLDIKVEPEEIITIKFEPET